MKKLQAINTDRLWLRPLNIGDTADLHQVYRHPEAMRFWDFPPHTDIAQTRILIESKLAGPGDTWTIYLKDGERGIGHVEYIGNPGVPGMGYILYPNYWRQGYMSEAVRAALNYGFDVFGLDRVELWINEDNLASQHLAEQVGFIRRGRFRQKYHHHESSHDKFVYGLHRDEWRRPKDEAPVPQHHAQFYALHPVLDVSDVQATANYYRDRLGFSIDYIFGDPPVHGQVSQGEWTLEAARIQLSQADNADGKASGVTLYIFVGSDIDGLYKRYRAAGVVIHQDITSQPWGMREFQIKDLNGYILRFGTPI